MSYQRKSQKMHDDHHGCYCNICTSSGQNIPQAQVVNEGQDQHGHRLERDAGIPWTQNQVTQVYTRSGVSPCTSCISLLHSAPKCDRAGPDPLQLALVMFSTIKWRTHVPMYICIQYQCQWIICMYSCEVCTYVLCVYLCASWERTVSYSKIYTGEIYSIENFSACTSNLTKWSNLRCYDSHTHTRTHMHGHT